MELRRPERCRSRRRPTIGRGTAGGAVDAARCSTSPNPTALGPYRARDLTLAGIGWNTAGAQLAADAAPRATALAREEMHYGLSSKYGRTGKGSMKSTDKMPDSLWTPTEVAAYLNVPIQTLYQWRRKRTGPPGRRVGRHLRYDPVAVRAWFADPDDIA
jgi:hypothetical protein